MLNSIYDVYYIKFALQFVDKQIDELVSTFNHEVGLRATSSMRAYHNQALIDEFLRRGIDVTAVHDGQVTSYAHRVRYDIEGNRLVLTD